MSIDISTCIKKPFLTHDFYIELARAITDLTGINELPNIKNYILVNGNKYNVITEKMGEDTALYIVSFEGINGVVDLVIVNNQEISENIFASVDINSPITPMEFLIAGAVIIAISRFEDSLITDEMLYWTDVFEQTANDFIRKMKVDSNCKYIYESAADMFSVLHKDELG